MDVKEKENHFCNHLQREEMMMVKSVWTTATILLPFLFLAAAINLCRPVSKNTSSRQRYVRILK